MNVSDLTVSLRSPWLAVIGSFPTPLSCQTEMLWILLGSADIRSWQQTSLWAKLLLTTRHLFEKKKTNYKLYVLMV